jgi:hypothetical protein
VLDFYARRSPIFLAAVFDAGAAAERGQVFGDGTPVHITIPTDNPWVPLRILGLGKQAEEFIGADVFLLTDREPAYLPAGRDGLVQTYSQAASDLVLNDLRADAGMGWIPESAWLTKLLVNTPAAELKYDLAVDASGAGNPSPMDAGLVPLPNAPNLIPLPNTGGPIPGGGNDSWFIPLGVALALVSALAFFRRRWAEVRA